MTAVPIGRLSAASLRWSRTPPPPASATRSGNCPKIDSPLVNRASTPEMVCEARIRWMPYERPLRASSSSAAAACAATRSLPVNSTWNSSITATMRGIATSGRPARRSTMRVTPARFSSTARRLISRASSRSTARPYSRSDSMPTVRACGIHDPSIGVGVNSANDTPSLKSSRYRTSSSGLYRDASPYSTSSRNTVLPEPVRPPTSQCGVTSSSASSHRARPSRPTVGAQPAGGRLGPDLAGISAAKSTACCTQSALTTQRQESDQVEILSGLFEGVTLGTPIAMVIRNTDARSKDYDALKDVFRPGHADYSYFQKYGVRDHRGGGRSSGRETAGRVAAGALAKAALATVGVTIVGGTVQVGTVRAERRDWEETERNPVRCPVMIDDLVTWAVVARGQMTFRDRHADAIGESLAKRAGGGLDTRRQAALGMTGRDAAPLAELFDLFQR